MKNNKLNKETIVNYIYSKLGSLKISFNVYETTHGYIIEPLTNTTAHYRKDYFDGMAILINNTENNIEVVEQLAGENENELWIYKETKSIKVAFIDLMKGNKREPIKIWS